MAPAAIRPEAPYVVRQPQAGDAIGCALRDAFVRQPLPDDMQVLVQRLNGMSVASLSGL